MDTDPAALFARPAVDPDAAAPAAVCIKFIMFAERLFSTKHSDAAAQFSTSFFVLMPSPVINKEILSQIVTLWCLVAFVSRIHESASSIKKHAHL